ncbi:MAG: a-glycosyltransferase, Glycosyltransferase Family 4-like protein [Frankiales bacterium]|nr:a-glycosyltransferase, Glycosyltransferase Family 4-like protein [Frankiales bacterium]
MTADTVGGVWTYCVELAHALDAQVHLATMGRPLSDAQRAEAGVFASLHESTFPLEWQDDPWPGVDAAGAWLLELERQLKPDVVHLNGYVHAMLAWSAPVLVVAHSDVVSWFRAVQSVEAPPVWDTYRARVTAGLQAAGAVAAPTAAAAADLVTSYGFSGAVVVPNGRRPELVPPGHKEPIVLAAGRVWDAAKGIDALCRVAPALPGRVLVGGEGQGDLPGVEVLGVLPFPQLAELMGRAAVFAAPARYEPFGLGILEAGLAACALVLGDLPSLREVWADAAVYVTGDRALQAALHELLADPALAAERGTQARQRALGYAPGRTAAGCSALYERLAS